MYVRFVVGADDENPSWLTGVIIKAGDLLDEGALYEYESALLEQTFAWFNEHLPCPPFKAKLRSGEWTREAVCWFRPEAEEPLERIWDLVALLKERGTPVRMITTRKPGRIVYSDPHQVVAETPYWA